MPRERSGGMIGEGESDLQRASDGDVERLGAEEGAVAETIAPPRRGCAVERSLAEEGSEEHAASDQSGGGGVER